VSSFGSPPPSTDLARRGFHNADVYRNLGNASLLADDLPRAILAYRRGLALAPNDWTMRQNLAHARTQVAYPTGDLGHPPAEALPPWLPRLGSGPCLAVALLAYLAGCIALTRWFMIRNRRLFVLGIVLLAVGSSGADSAAGWRGANGRSIDVRLSWSHRTTCCSGPATA
jgi:hypothetical protein